MVPSAIELNKDLKFNKITKFQINLNWTTNSTEIIQQKEIIDLKRKWPIKKLIRSKSTTIFNSWNKFKWNKIYSTAEHMSTRRLLLSNNSFRNRHLTEMWEVIHKATDWRKSLFIYLFIFQNSTEISSFLWLMTQIHWVIEWTKPQSIKIGKNLINIFTNGWNLKEEDTVNSRAYTKRKQLVQNQTQ